MAKQPHFAFPFRVERRSVAVVEQDSIAEIESCVEATLRTPLGTRLEEPEYGIPDETFAQVPREPGAEIYLAAVEEQEPRARGLGTARLQELAIKHVTIELEGQGV